MSIAYPYGVDIDVQGLQTYLQANLWTTKVYTAYGRAYINYKDGFKVPEVINESSSQTGQYSEVLFNNAKDATSFFVVDDNRKYIGKANTGEAISVSVDLIFQVQLNKIYPLLTHRCSEEVICDVQKLINKYPKFDIKEVKTGVKAYEDFEVMQKTLIESNMQPFFTFKFVLELVFFQEINF